VGADIILTSGLFCAIHCRIQSSAGGYSRRYLGISTLSTKILKEYLFHRYIKRKQFYQFEGENFESILRTASICRRPSSMSKKYTLVFVQVIQGAMATEQMKLILFT